MTDRKYYVDALGYSLLIFVPVLQDDGSLLYSEPVEGMVEVPEPVGFPDLNCIWDFNIQAWIAKPLDAEDLPDLQKWRVDSAIDLTPGLREKINAAIEAMPDPARTISKNKLASVQMFSRQDPLFSSIGAAVGMTEPEIDEMWRQAAAL